jgi:protein-L-isoaspartate(D-aspartate) O-methyltransferase
VIDQAVEWEPRATALAGQLTARGAITDPAWRAVFASVPRHVFVPRYWALDEYNSPATLVDGTDPDRRAEWLDAVYADQFLITQWAPGDHDGRPVRVVTSSASQPCTVAVMLDRLAVAEGHRVLEVGTGTGYTAALLSARLGEHLVTSLDIDPMLVATATDALAGAGYRPGLYAGDGGAGWPCAAPFDRVIATCSVERIPPAWIDQLAPGGRIVVPLTFGGALAVLDKTGAAQVSGPIDSFAVYFMPLRKNPAQAKPDTIAPVPPAMGRTPHRGTTEVDLRDLDDPDFQLWLALHLPGVHLAAEYERGQRTGITVYTARERATCRVEPAGQGITGGLRQVTQHGGRPWDTVEAAWSSWNRAGRPNRERLRLTARNDGTQHLHLEYARQPYVWPMPLEPGRS